ncbi:MAG: uroporphyrinogen decarboxylase family protein [Anaerolineae bacterium]
MPEMTCEERVLCALNREEPDRVPLYDLVDSVATIEHYAGRTLTLENAHEVVPLAMSRVLDTTRVWLPQRPGARVDERGFRHERPDWWNEWQVQMPFSDLPGLAAFVEADIERAEAWQPDDLSHVRDLVRADVAGDAEHLQGLLRWKERYAPTVIPASTVGEALADAYIPVGLDMFVYLEAEQPDLITRWIDAIHRRTMRRLQSEGDVRRVSPIAWMFADLAYKGKMMFSPGYLRARGVFRRMAEICSHYHGLGIKVIFHSDGFILPIVPDLIGAGVDALAPIETSAGLNLAELKQSFGDQVAFVGGIDVPQVLRYGSVDDVRRTVLQALADAGPGGGFILGSSSEELFDTLPPQNILAMFETTQECGRYPIGSAFPKHFDWR